MDSSEDRAPPAASTSPSGMGQELPRYPIRGSCGLRCRISLRSWLSMGRRHTPSVTWDRCEPYGNPGFWRRACGRGETRTSLPMILAQITHQDYANCDDGNEGCRPSRCVMNNGFTSLVIYINTIRRSTYRNITHPTGCRENRPVYDSLSLCIRERFGAVFKGNHRRNEVVAL